MNKKTLAIVVALVAVIGALAAWWYAAQRPIISTTTEPSVQKEIPSNPKKWASTDFSWQVTKPGTVSLQVGGVSGTKYPVGTYGDCETVDPPYPPAVQNEISRKICWNGGSSILLDVVMENGYYLVKQTDIVATSNTSTPVVLGTSKVLFEVK